MKAQLIQVQTKFISKLAKATYVFNKRIKGVTTTYDKVYALPACVDHRLDIMRPTDGINCPCVIYLHGGGWIGYDKNVIRTTCKRIAHMGMVVFNCNYSLAPKHTLADMEQDVISAIKYAVENAQKYGGNPNKILLMGDSAGAHMSALVTSKLLLGKYPSDNELATRIVGLGLFYGVFNMRTALTTGFPRIKTYVNSVVKLKGEHLNKRLIDASPTHYITPTLPPVFMASGAIDKLHATQSHKYAQALRKAGVPVTTVFFGANDKNAKHTFINFDKTPANVKALQELEVFLSLIK